MNFLGIVADKTGIGVCLIGRVANNSVVVGNVSADAEMHVVVHDLGLSPLLQFNDDDVVLAVFISSDYDEIYTLGSLDNAF